MSPGFLLELTVDSTITQYGKKYNMIARRFPLHNSLAAGLFAFVLLSTGACADPLQDATKLLKQNQHAQALEQVDKFLASKPKDAQGRFLRGVILTEMGRTNDAIAIFSRLSADYPQLPEPYNNLAVIYAQQKQYDKAKQALETAIRTHPSYATAHENLGDIYTRMASQAYDKALQLDSSNSTAQTKLAMIRDLMGGQSKPGPLPTTPAPVASPIPAPAPVMTVPSPAAPKPVEQAKLVTPPKPVVVATAEAPASRPPAPPVQKSVEPAAKDTTADANAEVNRVVSGWAKAWSKKDVKTYLSHYAKDFKVPGGVSRSAWEAERNQRIKKPGTIEVTIDDLKVVSNGPDQVVAKFRQHYKSATLKSSSSKVLNLIKRDGKWQIQQERIGS